jgi:hypothetical protein
VLASLAPQAHSQPAKAENDKANAVATAKADKHAPGAADDKAQRCPGTQYPNLKCEAISAQSDLETARQSLRQANQSARQGDLFRTEIAISFLTMCAAFAAAGFAAVAARATRDTVKAFIKVEDAHLVIDLEPSICGSSTPAGGPTTYNYTFKVTVSNIGRSVARLQRVSISTLEGAVVRSFGETLKADATTELSDPLWFSDTEKATLSITYATALHPITTIEWTLGLKVLVIGRKAEAYIISSRTGRPKEK